MSERIRELTTHELESVVGGVGGWAFTAGCRAA
jgi:bacteriocin-like protein